MNWTTPEAVRRQVERLWDNGELLAARLAGSELFPREFRLRRPGSRELTDRYGEALDWIRALQQGAREAKGYGYTIRWERVNHRLHGANDLPRAVVVPTEDDALRLIRRVGDAARFSELAGGTVAAFPSLRPWLLRRPLTLLEHADAWPRILAVLDWFRRNPRPGIYLRQLDIPGVDTKFIEGHRRLFAELLDAVLPADAVEETARGARQFERRFGLRAKPPLVRFRILDPALAVQGLDDLSIPAEQFAALWPPVRRVFITENDINGLAFPPCPASLVVFGLGYGLERLAEVGWLRQTVLYYWGDIDTHGFAILNRLRTALPAARSFLMDRATLDAHRSLWGQEPADRRFTGTLANLTEAEQALFLALREDRLGVRIRLEQERVGYERVREQVGLIAAGDSGPSSPDG